MQAALSASRAATTRTLQWQWLQRVAYAEALALQSQCVMQRRQGEIPDTLLLLEHPHVITLGTSASAEHLLLDDAQRGLLGIECFETGRGGDVTYHGPGQLVGYPIIDLKPDRRDLHRYVRDLEETLMRTLAHFDIRAQRVSGYTGVWVGNEKIAAIGVRVSSGWITSHGFALNVDTDLRYFDAIVPCGISDRGVTSIARRTGVAPDITTVAAVVAQEFAAVFERALAA